MRLSDHAAPTNELVRAGMAEVPKHMRREKKPYLERNKDIVLETASLIVAPDATEEQTIRYMVDRALPAQAGQAGVSDPSGWHRTEMKMMRCILFRKLWHGPI
jgi:hypothetical protein